MPRSAERRTRFERTRQRQRGCTSRPLKRRGRGAFTAAYRFSQNHTYWRAWGNRTEGTNVLKNGFICGGLSKSSSAAQEEAWLWELSCSVSSWLTEHIPEISLLGGMPWSDFFFFFFFMMRVFQDVSLFQATALETAEGGQRALLAGLKETFFLAGRTEGHEWGGSSPEPPSSPAHAGGLHGQSQASLRPGNELHVRQSQGWRRLLRPGAGTRLKASRSQLRMRHGRKQLQSCPKLHELRLLPSPKERKAKRHKVTMPFARHEDYRKPAENFPLSGSPAQVFGFSRPATARSCWQKRAASWHWLRGCLHKGCLLKLQTDKTNDCVERCS